MSEPFVGEIRLFGFPRVPDGWLACDGQVLSIAEYDILYAVIGTTYGGDGLQTFNLPDLRGRVPIGQGQGLSLPMFVLGQRGGEDSHTLIDQEMPAHCHALISSTAIATTTTPGPTVHLATASSGHLYARTPTTYEAMAPCIQVAGQSAAHNNVMPTLVANYCIAYDGIFPSPG